MYILLSNIWFLKLIRQFFFSIDKIVFDFVASIYDLLLAIARTSILSQADIKDFSDRIYKLLAVFMIFKVTFSLIMYVVNPDDFSDKTKGVGKLGTNIAITLGLLILTPYIFSYAYQAQSYIIESNTLAALVMGDNSANVSFMNTAGESMAFTTLSAFFTPDTSILSECVTLMDGDTVNPDCSGLSADLEENLNPNTMMNYAEKDLVIDYVKGIENQNVGLMFRQDLALTTANEGFLMNYKFIFSTVTGVVLILMLITFCMDIAVRSIKLAFLQLIAPIPIISYVDPKSGKDGMFKKWYQMCFKTFTSLFVRLLGLYFAVYIISKISNSKLTDMIDGSTQTNLFLKIFIIIGALMFAKQFPKILEGLGIKLDSGGFTLNPLKKMEKDMIGGGALKPVNSALSKAAKYPGRVGLGALTAAGVTLGALATGKGLRGGGKAFMGALKGEKLGKNFTNSYKSAQAKKQQVAKMKADGVKARDVRKENFLNKFRGLTPQDELDNFNSTIKAVQDDYKTYYNGVLGADKVAKALELRRVAAENAGDAQKARLLQDAIDERVKAVQSSGGRISLSGDAQKLEQFAIDVENGAAVYSNVNSYNAGLSSDVDKGLNSTEKHMASMIKYADKHFDGKFDYISGELGTVTGDSVDNLKISNGKSKSVERAANSSEDARYVKDTYKYVDNKSKK